MKLNRALAKFTTSAIWYWDAAGDQWLDSGSKGSLQVFDRFITERSFGQKKRILTMAPQDQIPDEARILRIGDSNSVFLLEKFNEDIRFDATYGLTYLLHEAAYRGTLRKLTLAENAAGVRVGSTVSDLAVTWADVERFSSAASRRFEETEFTIATLTFARGTVLDSDMYFEIDSGGGRYNIDEVYSSLDLVAAKGKRIGP